MQLTPEYLKKCEDTIQRNFDGYIKNIHDKATLDRLNAIKKFIIFNAPFANKVLSVGSGGFEPHFINASYACDISALSAKLLASLGWQGVFFPCSCDNIPYPSQYFDVAYCTEVIEHLPTLDDVRRTILEVARVGKFFLFTTPSKDVHEPTHNFIFTEKDLSELTIGLPCHIEQRGIFYYIHNGERKIFD